jgi:hypothetical protein
MGSCIQRADIENAQLLISAVTGHVHYRALPGEEFFAGGVETLLLCVELLERVDGAGDALDQFDLNRGGV